MTAKHHSQSQTSGQECHRRFLDQLRSSLDEIGTRNCSNHYQNASSKNWFWEQNSWFCPPANNLVFWALFKGRPANHTILSVRKVYLADTGSERAMGSLWQRSITSNHQQGVRNVPEASRTSCEAVWINLQQENTEIIDKIPHQKHSLRAKNHDFFLQKIVWFAGRPLRGG